MAKIWNPVWFAPPSIFMDSQRHTMKMSCGRNYCIHFLKPQKISWIPIPTKIESNRYLKRKYSCQSIFLNDYPIFPCYLIPPNIDVFTFCKETFQKFAFQQNGRKRRNGEKWLLPTRFFQEKKQTVASRWRTLEERRWVVWCGVGKLNNC